MPTISRTVIERPRVQRKCERCRQPIQGATARLYGYANEGEKPYTIYEHADAAVCVENERQMWDRLARPLTGCSSETGSVEGETT
jgi:hypothetical protein